MSEPSRSPAITPQFCFATTALRDFLRISRSSIDDSISQNLNALVTPSRRGFDPRSTASRQDRASASHQFIDSSACEEFKNEILFQSWQARSDVLDYCAHVARTDDPDDPDAVQRQIDAEKDRSRVVDERLDPYSGRFFPREARTEVLESLIQNERGVEAIIRARTWGVVNDRCGTNGEKWQEALSRWQKGKEVGK